MSLTPTTSPRLEQLRRELEDAQYDATQSPGNQYEHQITERSRQAVENPEKAITEEESNLEWTQGRKGYDD